jgi:hypothetical protein
VKRRTAVILGALAVLVVAAAGGAYAWHRLATGGKVTEVGVAEALDRYREQIDATTTGPSATTVPAPTLTAATTEVDSVTTLTTSPTTEIVTASTTNVPFVHSLVAPGVYQYATRGFDRVDALTGARHDYPEITTITVVPFGCGVRLRWDVAVERWDSWDWCLDGSGLRQTGWVGYHEFFGTPGQNDYACDGDPRPLDAPAGTMWAMTCRMADRTATAVTGTVIERTTLMVAGTEIPVLRLRYEVDVVGESTGHQSVEGWYRTTDGLPVREHLTITTKQDTAVGTTNFDETYTIDLLTATPAS